MNKFVTYIIAILAASVVFGVAVAPTTFAIQGGGFGGRPAHPDPKNPRTNDIFIYNLEAGKNKKDAVVVSNNTDTTQTIDIYATDSVISNTGAYSCKQRVEDRSDVGKWIKLSKDTVTLKAGERSEVPFTISLPDKVEPGEHNGCIAFESADDKGQIDGNVRIHMRSALRVAVTVPGELKRKVTITNFGVVDDNGNQTFTLSAKNEGNVSSDTKFEVDLTTLFGINVYHNEGVYPIIADNKYDASYVNETRPFWGGWYKASGSITYVDNPKVFGVNEHENTITELTGTKYIFVMPNAVAVAVYAVVLAILLGAISYIIYDRNEKKEALRNWRTYTVKKGDTLQSLAETNDVSWKKLARINSIKAPYTINKDDVIYLPRKKSK